MKYFWILVILFSPLIYASAQQDVHARNISITGGSDRVIIGYDLVATKPGVCFDVNVKLTDSSSGKITWNAKANGATGLCVLPGNHKSIVLSLKENGVDSTASYSIAIIAVQKQIMGGPSSALKSLMVPGLGDMYVYRNGEVGGSLIAIAAYGLIGYGVYSKISSINEYKNYHAATDQALIDNYYNSANIKNQNFNLYTSIGAGIWLLDIAQVYLRGKANKRKLSRNTMALRYEFSPGMVCSVKVKLWGHR